MILGPILVRDVFHFIQVAKTLILVVFFAPVMSLAVSFVSEFIFWKLVEKMKYAYGRTGMKHI